MTPSRKLKDFSVHNPEWDKLPTSRNNAKRVKSTQFYTGTECMYGHKAPRVTANRRCKACIQRTNINHKISVKNRKDWVTFQDAWLKYPKTRKEAKLTGAEFYYSKGRVCVRGHNSPYNTKRHECMACSQLKSQKRRNIAKEKKRKALRGRKTIDYSKFNPEWLSLPSNRAEAIAQGESRYYDDRNKCPENHNSPRYSSNSKCVHCQQIERTIIYDGAPSSDKPTGTLNPGSKPVRVQQTLKRHDEARNLYCQFYDDCLAWSWNGFANQGIYWGSSWACSPQCKHINNSFQKNH